MTYNIEEFKTWLIAHNRLNAWTTPSNYLDYVIKNHWGRGITEKNLEWYFVTGTKFQEFNNDFVAWITEVDKKGLNKQLNNAQEFFNERKNKETVTHITLGENSSNKKSKYLSLEIIGVEGSMIITNFLSGELDLSIFPNLKKLTLNTKEQNFGEDFFINISKNKNSVEIENFANWSKNRILMLPKEIKETLVKQEQELKELTTKLAEHDTNLSNTRSLLDKANSELINKQQELIAFEEGFQIYEKQEEQIYQKYQDKINDLEETIKNQTIQLTTKTEELNDLKAQFGVKDETIKTKQQEITTKYQELVIKNRELDKLKADYQIQQTKIADLETQLTGLTLASGLLVKQVEDLTNQLSSSQLSEQSAKLEREIKENLLTSKENELADKDNQISQQATKLNSYQQIIRNSEANLSKVQDIISTKTEQIEKLEEEKDHLSEQLEQAEEDIKQLEISFIASQTKINALETRIKELESDNANQLEIDKLKQQLVQEQNNHQQIKTQSEQQIKKLQSELVNIKNRESQLSLKIQALTTQQEIVNEEIKTISLWTKIRTPFLILSGLGTIIFAIRLLKGKSEE